MPALDDEDDDDCGTFDPLETFDRIPNGTDEILDNDEDMEDEDEDD